MEKEQVFSFLVTILVLGLIVGLYYGRALISIGFVGLAVLAFTYQSPLRTVRELFSSKNNLAFVGIFVLYLISGLWSENTGTYLSYLKINLPFLLMPIAAMVLHPFIKPKALHFLYFFVIVSFVSVCLCLGEYALNYESVNLLYNQGMTMNTPIIHIRYAFFLSIATLLVLEFLRRKYVFKYAWERYFQYFILLFFSIFIHMLAVRTGLVCFYVVVMVYALWWMVKAQNKLRVVLSLFAVMLFGVMMVLFYPSLQNRLAYAKWEWSNIQRNIVKIGTSDQIRYYSIIFGLELAKENPIMGVGIGDLETEMRELYQERVPQIEAQYHFPPVNQYVGILATFGFLGSLFFFGCFFFPCRHLLSGGGPLLAGFYAAHSVAFLGDNSIDLQIGKLGFLLLLFLILAIIVKDVD